MGKAGFERARVLRRQVMGEAEFWRGRAWCRSVWKRQDLREPGFCRGRLWERQGMVQKCMGKAGFERARVLWRQVMGEADFWRGRAWCRVWDMA
jgi:hypothetical protein